MKAPFHDAISAAVVVLTVVLGLRADPAAASEPVPTTFARDVAPIVFEHCVTCHRPGESAPFPLLSYQDARKRGKQIVMVTESGFMPPWLPVPGHGEFEGARGLTDEERRTLRRWFDQGMPEGDPDELPPVPTFTQGWQLGEPDLVVELADDYTLPAEGIDVIRNFVIPSPAREPRWIESVELRPNNKRIVHHAVMKVDRTATSRRLDREDPEPGFPGMSMGNAEDPDGYIIVWTPGATAYPGTPGMAWRLRPGDDIVLQLHMVPVGAAEPVRVRIGLHFADGPPERETFAIVMREDDIDIPAGAKDYRIEDTFELPVPVDVVGIYPHAHYLGKTMHVNATLPDGSRRWLLRIDDWDFNWQGMYRYAKPVRLPAGTSISMTYTYDNSTDNVRNPNYPPKRVVAGNRSSDEMGNLALQVVAVRSGDLPALREANWRAMLEKDPDDTGALFNLGVEHARREDYAKAAFYYERAIRLDPFDEGIQFALAGTYVKLNDRTRAIARYEQVIRINPRNVEALFVLGWLLSIEGRLDEAAVRLEGALAIDPGHALAHHRLGVVRERQGRTESAIEHLREALRLEPDLTIARKALDRVLRASADELD